MTAVTDTAARAVARTSTPLLAVRDLVVRYGTPRRPHVAVNRASFTVDDGEVLGVLGESGSGKSTIGRAVLGLAPVHSGTIEFDGRDITHASRRERRTLATRLQVVFQDPRSSLNPAVKVGPSLLESLPATTPRDEAELRMFELLDAVGLPRSAADSYPSRFSGGQRQRLAIARALMPSPRLVVCDEPVSALDVSIQAQVLNLLRELRESVGLSYLFIGHNIDVVRYMSDRIMVLYRGEVVEQGPAEIIARTPSRAYTKNLIAASPSLDDAFVDAPARRVTASTAPTTFDPNRKENA